MINHVTVKASAMRLSYITQNSASFSKVSAAEWDKNLENDIKMLMSLSEKLLYVGQEYSFICTKKM